MNDFNKQRVCVLIDGENIEYEASNVYNSKIDYRKLLQMAGSRELIRAIYFTPQGKLTKAWEHKLKSWGLEVKTSPKNADTYLTVTAITLVEKYDTIVLVGGDADYLPLLWFLQGRGAKAEVWSFDSCTSNELKALADEYIPLTTDILTDKTKNIVTITPNRRKRYA